MPALPRVDLEARSGMAVALRVKLANRMMAAALVRLAVDEWVASDGEILPAAARIEPAYVYLLQGAEVRQTVSLRVPLPLQVSVVPPTASTLADTEGQLTWLPLSPVEAR